MDEKEIKPTESTEPITPPTEEPVKKKKLPLALIILVVSLILVCIIGVVLFQMQKSKSSTSTPKAVDTAATIYFLTTSVEVPTTPTERTIDLLINSQAKSLTEAVIDMSYDPQYIEVINFKLNTLESSYFGPTVQLKEMRTNYENKTRTSIDLVLPTGSTGRKGKGSIGAVTFKIKSFPPSGPARVTFTQYTALNSSDPGHIILNTVPLDFAKKKINSK